MPLTNRLATKTQLALKVRRRVKKHERCPRLMTFLRWTSGLALLPRSPWERWDHQPRYLTLRWQILAQFYDVHIRLAISDDLVAIANAIHT